MERNNRISILAALQAQDICVVEHLLRNGCNVNETDIDGETPLHKAARHSKKITRLLLDAGASVNAKEEFGITPLFFAIDASLPEIVALLIEHGADVNSKLKNNATPLHYAVGKGDVIIVNMLLNAGADPNVQDAARMLTPLMVVAGSGQTSIVEALLAYGADVNIVVPKGVPFVPFAEVGRQTAIALALLYGHFDIASILEKAGAFSSDWSFDSRDKEQCS